MADNLSNPDFVDACTLSRWFVRVASRRGHPDAVELIRRLGGANNMQAHVNALVPMATAIARSDPRLLLTLRLNSQLQTPIAAARGARRAAFSRAASAATRRYLRRHGNDRIATEMRSGNPITAQHAADTYLSANFGGAHLYGGASDVTLKRALKILAHFSVI